MACELSTLNEDYRPNEIGSPFAIAGAGYFTDAAHQNHLHIGFKEEIARDWKPPKDVAVDGAEPAAPAASAAAAGTRGARGRARRRGRRAGRAGRARAVAAPVAEAPPKVEKGSQSFLKAVTAEAAEADRKVARNASHGRS